MPEIAKMIKLDVFKNICEIYLRHIYFCLGIILQVKNIELIPFRLCEIGTSEYRLIALYKLLYL